MVVRIVSATGERVQVPVGKDVSIGRDRSKCAILLPPDAPGVSRVHATIQFKSETELVLTDKSSYGTLVENSKVLKSSIILRNGTKISVGDSEFVVEWIQDAPAPLMAPSKRPLQTGEGSAAKRSKLSTQTQKKVSDFFANNVNSSQNVSVLKEEEVLAYDTPSYLCPNERAREQDTFTARSFVGDSQLKNEDAQVRPNVSGNAAGAGLTGTSGIKPGRPRGKKGSLLFPKKSTLVLDSNPLPRITDPIVDVTNGGTGNEDNDSKMSLDYLADSQRSRVANSIVADEGCAVVPLTTNNSFECEMNLDDVHSQMLLEPLANSTQRLFPVPVSNVPTPTAPVNKKRSILEQKKKPVKLEEISQLNDVDEFVPKKRGRPKKDASAKTMNASVSNAAAANSLLHNNDLSGVNDDFVAPPLPKTRGRPKKTVTKQEVVSFNNKAGCSALDGSVADASALMSMLCSGKKYEEVEDESQSQIVKPPGKGIRDVDIDTVVKKLDRMVSFADLVRTSQAVPENGNNGNNSMNNTTASNGGVNFKRFKKAGQGCFNTSIPKISTILGGSNDLVDFRQIRY